MLNHGHQVPRVFGHQIPFLLVITVSLMVFAACGSASTTTSTSVTPTPTATVMPSPTATATPSPTATPTPTATPGVTGYPIKVYFSNNSKSGTNLTAVFPVARVSPSKSVGTVAIEFLIAGPTPEERAAGYYAELNGIFVGPSTCGGPTSVSGPDFTLTLNKKGTTPEQGTATVKLCRPTASPGIGTDARVLATIKATLLQFSTIKKVVVLGANGHCFGDESTQDFCLK